MKEIVLATRNLGKIQELERMLDRPELEIRVMGLPDFPDLPDVEETGSTFIENALLKARAISAFTGIPALADDSGLCIDVLNGDPGIYSARWAGTHGDDEANLGKVLRQLSELVNPSLGAQFQCAVALVFPDGHQRAGLEIVHEGVLRGQIVMTPRGNHGFGYDPIFQPTGFEKTTAELSPDVKDHISHRGKAFQAMLPDLREFL